MIEPDLLERLRAIKARTGISESEQVRRGIRWWLESREWPARTADSDEPRVLKVSPAATRPRKRR